MRPKEKEIIGTGYTKPDTHVMALVTMALAIPALALLTFCRGKYEPVKFEKQCQVYSVSAHADDLS